jgi:hypothetical protein
VKPAVGVAMELALLAVILTSSVLFPPGLLFGLYLLLAEFLATYLVHCPAHYMVGRALGIRFQNLKLGRTTLMRALPKQLASFARLVPILTLSTERSSFARAPKHRVAYMYAAGAVASASSAIAIAVAATSVEPPLYATLAWALALAYLAFDVVFSPRSGDIMRARAALRP